MKFIRGGRFFDGGGSVTRGFTLYQHENGGKYENRGHLNTRFITVYKRASNQIIRSLLFITRTDASFFQPAKIFLK